MLKYVSTAEMNASGVSPCLNSACPLFSDNICVILLWLKLNKDVDFFFPLPVQAAFRGVVTVHAITPSWLALSLSSQIIIGLHFLAS